MIKRYSGLNNTYNTLTPRVTQTLNPLSSTNLNRTVIYQDKSLPIIRRVLIKEIEGMKLSPTKEKELLDFVMGSYLPDEFFDMFVYVLLLYDDNEDMIMTEEGLSILSVKAKKHIFDTDNKLIGYSDDYYELAFIASGSLVIVGVDFDSSGIYEYQLEEWNEKFLTIPNEIEIIYTYNDKQFKKVFNIQAKENIDYSADDIDEDTVVFFNQYLEFLRCGIFRPPSPEMSQEEFEEFITTKNICDFNDVYSFGCYGLYYIPLLYDIISFDEDVIDTASNSLNTKNGNSEANISFSNPILLNIIDMPEWEGVYANSLKIEIVVNMDKKIPDEFNITFNPGTTIIDEISFDRSRFNGFFSANYKLTIIGTKDTEPFSGTITSDGAYILFQIMMLSKKYTPEIIG